MSLERADSGRYRKRRNDDRIPNKESEASTSQSSLPRYSDKKSPKRHKHKKGSDRKKKKKHKRSSPERSPEPKKQTIEEMRAIRMQREAAERQRSIDLVSRLQRGQSTPARSVIDERTLKYNTGYMPKR